MSRPPETKSDDSWSQTVRDWFHDGLQKVEDQVDRRWDQLGERLGWATPRSIQPYTGWATPNRATVGGRVLATDPYGGPKDDDRWWENLLQTYRRWNSHELGGVPVTATFAGQTRTQPTDEEGYAWFTFDLPEPLDAAYWHEATLTADRLDDGHPAVSTTVGVMRPADHATVGLVSDMDDTVLHTGITDLLTAARLTFLGNAKTRSALPGVGALYRALVSGDPDATTHPVNPIFYVSSSAWNLHDLLSDFLDLNDLPLGPLLLQELGVDQTKLLKGPGHHHKLDKARRIVTEFPDLPFILVGDSGQADAHLYAQLAQERPDQIAAILIRDVDPAEASDRDRSVDEHLEAAQAAGVPAWRVKDSVAAAEHLIGLGKLDATLLPAIREATDAERGRPTLAEATTPGGK
jgi:phosphatidate phosphatase APP1